VAGLLSFGVLSVSKDFEDLIEDALKPLKAPGELDDLVKKDLSKRIAISFLETADKCMGSCPAMYAIEMVSLKGRPLIACGYITFDMSKLVNENTEEERVCVKQGDTVLPLFFKNQVEGLPVPRYRCLRYSKRKDSDNRRRMRR